MATLLPTHRAAIVNLYSALFSRAPDAAGLAFWAQAYADGASLSAITLSFISTTEGRAVYPVAQTSTEFVSAFYQTVFGRVADAGGQAFWTAALDAAGGAGSDAARASVAGQIIGTVSQSLSNTPEGISDAAYAQTVADRALFANKAVVGDYVVSLDINNVVLARQVLALVTQDPASIAIAKAFAANGGVAPTPPEPPSTAPVVFLVTNADSEVDIISTFAAYAGTTAAVDATNMSAAKLTAVAGGIAKIGSGGIHGVLSFDPSAYAGATLTTLAPKLAAGASLLVTGTAGVDDIALKQFERGTTIHARDGDDIFHAVVDAVTPANTTLSARHGLVGGAGVDTLHIAVTGTGVAAFNGASIASIETVQLTVEGSATLAANADVSKVVVVGPQLPSPAPLPVPEGSLSVSRLAAGASLVLDNTTSASTFEATYSAGVTTTLLTMQGRAHADVVSLGGGDVTSVMISKSGGAGGVNMLRLSSGIDALTIDSSGGLGILALSGGAASGVAITVKGTEDVGFSTINSAVTIFDASASTGFLAVSFLASVQQVIGGSGNNTLIVSGAATLTGGGAASTDVFALQDGVALTGPADNAGLLAKIVTITDFGSRDLIQVTPSAADPIGSLQTVMLTNNPASIYDAAVEALAALRVLSPVIPYVGFGYAGDTYILVDRGVDNVLGVGDVLIKLTGVVNLTGVTYDIYGMLTMA